MQALVLIPMPFYMINIQTHKSVFFASDFHLGIPNLKESQERERRIVSWMHENKEHAAALFLMGDLFDTWMEYKHVIPKGHSRFFGALAEYADHNIELFIFSGNHDVWMRDYFKQEFNAQVVHHPIQLIINDLRLEVGHGDGLGPNDYGYKVLKYIMRNPIAQWLYRRFHPNFGFGLASYLSKKGPKHQKVEDVFHGPEKEWIIQHCENVIEQEAIDYFIFGHRHLPIEYTLSNQISKYINLGDWIDHNTFVEIKGNQVSLKHYE